jgi:P4 family phage/plasmid primase-like protien
MNVTEALPNLTQRHTHELTVASAIDPEIIAERRYQVVEWTANDLRGRNTLKRLGIPGWARDGERGSGLLIPMYRPTGELATYQFKPTAAVRDREGKFRKYASVVGQTNRLDVHPRNRDRIVDPTVPLWITEGVKKADALTTAGACVVALTGVFNWRGQHGSLGDWEDVVIKGREVILCFDADTRTNPNVARAMQRCGKWLRSKGAARVLYLVVPATIKEATVKGADNYLAAGGTIAELRAQAVPTAPAMQEVADTFTDARLADTIAEDALAGEYRWAVGLGWMHWTGRQWQQVHEKAVVEHVRIYALEQFAEASAAVVAGGGSAANAALDGWKTMLSGGRLRAVLNLAGGIVLCSASDFDCHHDLLNTPSGVVDLTTGDLLAHDPALLMTKMTSARYRAGATHDDWNTALQAIPHETLEWAQLRFGQAATGLTPTDDLMVVQQGGGENGKTTVGAAIGKALGDYYTLVPDRVILGNPGDHPTEIMTLRGARFALVEETPEARQLQVARIKKIVGTPEITARLIKQDSVTFTATHTLFVSTNYRPQVNEVDHGTWRRLALLRYPYRYGTEEAVKNDPEVRRSDPTLRDRVRDDPSVQEAVLAWLVDGAVKWFAAGRITTIPRLVSEDTRAWRGESDVVLAFLDDRIVFEPESHVMASDLLTVLNSWLTEREHHKWSDKLLANRFGDHVDVTSNGVEKRKVRRQSGLSRPNNAWLQQAPNYYAAWFGIRFRQDRDDALKEAG